MPDDLTVCNECQCPFCEGKAQIVDLCPLHQSASALLAELGAINVIYYDEDGWWLELRSQDGKIGAFPLGSNMGPIARSTIKQWKVERDAAIAAAKGGD